MNSKVAKFLQTNKKALLEAWMTQQLANETFREDFMSTDELRSQSDEFLTALLKIMGSATISDFHSITFEPIRDILSNISISRARQGYTPTETGLFILSLKETLTQLLGKEYAKDTQYLFDAIVAVNQLLDTLSIFTFESFIKGREEVILRQTDEMSEISTPVIRVWEGIVALPIIGTLDSMRTQTVMENLLQEIVATGSSIAILDISGVPAVDSLVAQHLIKTVSATRLMGAECIISGIRPEIAQTIVHLGIDLSQITTKATLASALRVAFAMLKLTVIPTPKLKASHG